MKSPLTFEQLEGLRRLDACLLANTIETFHERLRNEGFMGGNVRCLFPQLQPMIGYAATVNIRGSAPPTTGRLYTDRTDWWDYVSSVPVPRIVVIEDSFARPGLGSIVGSVHMNILRALHCTGALTNGSVRDLPAAESAGFHYFAGGVSVSHAYLHIVEFGKPVEIDGLKIRSGDLMHGDLHGVQTVPLDIAPLIPGAAAKIATEEQALIALCRSPDFSLQKLRAAVKRRS